MFTKIEADRLSQNITYITRKDSGFRVSLPLPRAAVSALLFSECILVISMVGSYASPTTGEKETH